MGEFHVGFYEGDIVAGTMNEDATGWLQSTEVTDEALAAVRDWLYSNRPEGAQQIGWKWHKKDGGVIALVLMETFGEDLSPEPEDSEETESADTEEEEHV